MQPTGISFYMENKNNAFIMNMDHLYNTVGCIIADYLVLLYIKKKTVKIAAVVSTIEI